MTQVQVWSKFDSNGYDNVLVSGWIRAVRGSDRLGSEHVNIITMTI